MKIRLVEAEMYHEDSHDEANRRLPQFDERAEKV